MLVLYYSAYSFSYFFHTLYRFLQYSTIDKSVTFNYNCYVRYILKGVCTMKLKFNVSGKTQPDPFIFEDNGKFYIYVTANNGVPK